MQQWYARLGPLLVVVTRALPVLAEATILLLGVHRVGRRAIWLPLAASNLAIAVAYSAFGQFVNAHGWLLPGLLAAAAVPMLVTLLLSRFR